MIWYVHHFRDSESGRWNTYFVEADNKPTEQQVINALGLNVGRYEKLEIGEEKVVKITN